jgi:hypothetical protein
METGITYLLAVIAGIVLDQLAMHYIKKGEPIHKPYGYGYQPVTDDLTDPPEEEQQDVRVGQRWYIRLPNETTLTKLDIIKISNKVVTFRLAGNMLGEESHYNRRDVVFVEKV